MNSESHHNKASQVLLASSIVFLREEFHFDRRRQITKTKFRRPYNTLACKSIKPTHQSLF